MAVTLRPLGDRVVIKPSKADEKTAGGIIIPDSANKDKPVVGKVVAVGPGKLTDDGKRVPPDVKVNDEVFYSKYAGTDLKVNGEDLLIISESEILAVNAK
jgi:chaperonin GroES